ncbi:MAG: HAMP domain-containing histidine kinase [Cyanobacteria bacterium]|nr:HAMP domain-containing histidine kinase [Cyanobacteria bacterium CG_2015-16_32_12]NCO77407.1 HAMP domain-containing histidine kinase [Cyanobacteria bacterium CG_2015-22_32_23]NCQ03483.1 HAMP domain-containing histidine kinase [Cyanobacteria bacterium CG_2015-09_32_10]NCQ42264.1 HAMP domain-containing histidine kinase [Cyanobacteria bacterium CG_2015-04_32_10]NCS83958.1 HAMP domain-containing histidine kinase [Cyanobacteria bacterium CG_2015-02_32_10]
MLYFLCGLTVGLILYVWKSYQINVQLTEILHLLSPFEAVDSLSKIAQVRRNVNLLNNQFYYTQLELDLHHYLIKKIPLGYLRIDEENRLIECNEEAKILLHIQRWNPEVLRLFLELVRSYELDQLIQQTRKTQQNLVIEWQFFPTTNYVLEDENSLEIENYKPIFLKAYSYPLPAEQVSIFIENKQLIKELSNRRDEAYSDLSHELRTPLTSMSLLAETLLKYTDDKGKIWMQQMSQEINRLIDLVQNWLEISTLEKNPYETLKFQNLDLKQLILSAWKSLKILADQQQISLEYQGEEKIVICADLNRLTQVFVNLFDNSIKHSYSGDLITVKVEIKENSYNDKFLVINVIDSGTGFNDNDLPYIFERLYRGDKSRVRNAGDGSGLGLSIVKQIIEAHQGSITANNHPKTKGAWFKIVFAFNKLISKN